MATVWPLKAMLPPAFHLDARAFPFHEVAEGERGRFHGIREAAGGEREGNGGARLFRKQRGPQVMPLPRR